MTDLLGMMKAHKPQSRQQPKQNHPRPPHSEGNPAAPDRPKVEAGNPTGQPPGKSQAPTLPKTPAKQTAKTEGNDSATAAGRKTQTATGHLNHPPVTRNTCIVTATLPNPTGRR
ncbi:hypothetical protein [Methylovulum sp.]|uniref:hypothetical protein n=1 Tax=Methylovulum sp. TaxID=1916980 RepID=UPI00261B68CF|nr:hypothetical protein [Methylovulum sp.]MDD5126228.1 hypothetical protein [Methylovulum sp.]